jgi:hypothetical protein
MALGLGLDSMRGAVLSVGISLFLAASEAQANLLVNGGLETTVPVPAAGTIICSPSANPTALDGWIVTGGSVDIVPTITSDSAVAWKSDEGNFSVDMIGVSGAGTLKQTVSTQGGGGYDLSFAFSVNPYHTRWWDEFGTTKVLQVSVLGADGATLLVSQTFTGTVGNRTNMNMQYVQESLNFIGDGSRATVVFAALPPLNLPDGLAGTDARNGPVIDAVDLEGPGGSGGAGNIPEPGTVGMLGVGVMLLLRRR